MNTRVLAAASIAFCAAAAHSTVFYSNTIQSASRYNPNGTTPARISFDDAIITTTAPKFAVTKVTFGIRRLANAGAVDVEGFLCDLPWTTYAVTNPIALGTISLSANGASAVTEMVSFGDGTTSLGVVNLSSASPDLPGMASFGAGLRFSGANADMANNGWRIVARPASGVMTGQVGLSDDLFMGYENNTTSYFWFGGVANNTTNLPGSFVMIIEGQPVPEPATLACLGLGAIALVRRKRRR